jgi:hypothetical protein
MRFLHKGERQNTFNVLRSDWFNNVGSKQFINGLAKIFPLGFCQGLLVWYFFFGNTTSDGMWILCVAPGMAVTLITDKAKQSANSAIRALAFSVCLAVRSGPPATSLRISTTLLGLNDKVCLVNREWLPPNSISGCISPGVSGSVVASCTNHITFQYLCRKDGSTSSLTEAFPELISKALHRCQLQRLCRPPFRLPGRSVEWTDKILGMR